MRRCTITGCSRPYDARGWCKRHYMRWFRTGDPLAGSSYAIDVPADIRFWERVTASGACWQWEGPVNRAGYGQFYERPRTVPAHRWSWGHLVGGIPDDLVLDHLCRNHSCVDPDHLEPVTHAENVLRGYGISALNARKTHCKRGHLLAGDNLYPRADGGRECVTCTRERNARRDARGRGTASPGRIPCATSNLKSVS